VRHHFLRVLEEYLTAYLDGAGLRDDPKGPLFHTIGRGPGKLTRTVLPQANVYTMIRRLRRRRGSKPRSATTASEQLGSRPISRTAGRLKRPRRWRTTPQRTRRSFTTSGATR
jgi:hypothetical protein